MLLPCNQLLQGSFLFLSIIAGPCYIDDKDNFQDCYKKKHETKYDLLKTIQDGEITARNKRVNTECDIMA